MKSCSMSMYCKKVINYDLRSYTQAHFENPDVCNRISGHADF